MTHHASPSLCERLLDVAAELRALALAMLEESTGRDFDAQVSALLDRVAADDEAAR